MESYNDTTGEAGLSAGETAQLLQVLAAIRRGDFASPLPEGGDGVAGEVSEAVNAVIAQLQRFAVAASRLATATGVEGNLGVQMTTEGSEGLWHDMAENLNNMSLIIAAQVRDITQVAQAVADGDLSQKVTVAAGGEMAQLKETFNTMIVQLELLRSSVNKLMEKVNNLGLNPGQNAQNN